MAKPRRSRFSFAGWGGCFGGKAREKVLAQEEYPVKLHIYDLSQGVARQLSTTVLGKPIDAIWHTGVVVYGREYYFGGGIQQDRPGRTPYGTPVRVEDFVPMIQGLETTFRAGAAPQPSQFVHAPAAAMQTQPSLDIIQIQSKSVDADKTGDGKTTYNDNEIIPPVTQPTPAAVKQAQPSLDGVKSQSRSISADKTSIDKAIDDDNVPPAQLAHYHCHRF